MPETSKGRAMEEDDRPARGETLAESEQIDPSRLAAKARARARRSVERHFERKRLRKAVSDVFDELEESPRGARRPF